MLAHQSEELCLVPDAPAVYRLYGEGDSGTINQYAPWKLSGWCSVAELLNNLAVWYGLLWTSEELFARFPFDGRLDRLTTPPELLHHPTFREGGVGYTVGILLTSEQVADSDHLFVAAGWARRLLGALAKGVRHLEFQEERVVGFLEDSTTPVDFTF